MTVKEMGRCRQTSPAFCPCPRAQDFRSMADDEHQKLSTTPPYLEGHRLYRERIVSEDQLIHYRTSWSIWIQTLLVIIVGTLAVHLTSEQCTNKDEQFDILIIYGICCIGSVSALVSCASIIVALVEINKLKKRYEVRFYRHKIDAPWLPDLTASTPLHILGHLVNTVGPIVAAIAWISLAIALYVRCH